MTIQEAIKSHKPFRRKAWTSGDSPEYLRTDFRERSPFGVDNGHDGYEIYRDGPLFESNRISLRVEDILADDWETKDELVELRERLRVRGTDPDELSRKFREAQRNRIVDMGLEHSDADPGL